ncbi:hypothetical protein E1B28_001938 [Marasmius oreades]|uniref:Uncharacterized protein n=1 Tax=Marasmius oreades TaxID=181124 RepID=A0A9P7V4L0_9AGAR|nr:uncharacterized protein E1B28_001938 [Marasmius oreades]KAG7100158.1 hypothetical protein E1B28_001938 [Marasmius oreades]
MSQKGLSLSQDLSSLALNNPDDKISEPSGEGDDLNGENSEGVGLEGLNTEGGQPYGDSNRRVGNGEESESSVGLTFASRGRNAAFHASFPDIPEEDYLIDDYSCTLQRGIEGTLYVSKNHVSFRATQYGARTQFSIPIVDITSLKKKMTAYVIPDLLQITTSTSQFERTFVSLLARDSMYDVIYDAWIRVTRPANGADEGVRDGPTSKETTCVCLQDGHHYLGLAMDVVLPGTPERIHNLMFVSGFTKEFMSRVQKFTDIQISAWIPISPHESRLVRNISYTKDATNGSITLASAKCEILDELIHCDFDGYVSIISTMKAPAFPAGSLFSVKTRTCLMRASATSTRIIVSTQMKWTQDCFIRGSIDFWAMDSQRTYYSDLERAMSAYIRDYKSDFIPEGVDNPIISLSGSANPATRVAISAPPVPFAPPSENRFALSHPPASRSIATLNDIRTVLSLETAVDTLLDLEAPKVPPVLDLLQKEIQTKGLDTDYRRKCGKCLRLLVNKHHVLPPSLFMNKVSMRGQYPLAVGGYSDIYRGTFGDRSVCLKVLRVHIKADEERAKRELREFYKEALLWTQLSHPNLLSFLGVNTSLFPRRLCLVSPWMENGQINKFLESNPTHDRLRTISEIATGISYLHSHNIVHGDIKGANVLVDKHGRCHLADFGLAAASVTSTLLSTTTMSGAKGTIRWMAPELFDWSGNTSTTDSPDAHENSKRNNVKPSIDIYAYGCTVYEIIAGKPPFANLTDPQVIFQVIGGARPERPSASVVNWCPDNIWELVQQCWAQKRGLRPLAADVHAYLERLERLRVQGLSWEKMFPPSVKDE